MQRPSKRVLTLLLLVITVFATVPATVLAGPGRAKYVLVSETQGCRVKLDARTGKLTFKAKKGHFGHFTVVVKHGKKKIIYRFTVKKPEVKSKPPVVTVINPPTKSPPVIIEPTVPVVGPTVPVLGPTGPAGPAGPSAPTTLPGPGTPTSPPTPTPSPTPPTSAHSPVNASPPTLQGTPIVGDTITLSYGTWSGSASQTGTWYDCDAQGKQCSVSANQPSGNLYVVQLSDLGHTLVLAETAIGPGGSTTSDSNPTGIVAQPATPPPSPSLVKPPLLTGNAQEGQTLTLAIGVWTSQSQDEIWVDCNAQAQNCTPIAGQTSVGLGNSYVLQRSDVGHTIMVIETASGPGGTATVDSQPTAVVTATVVTPSVPLGAGAAFCASNGGLSIAGVSLDNVYPCANPNINDQFGYQCVEYSERFELVVYGKPVVGNIAGANVVSTYHTQDGVPMAFPGVSVLPAVGDVMSMWGDANQDPVGHTGVVAAVNVVNGSGDITLYDQNSGVTNGVSYGHSVIYVFNWALQVPWAAPYHYTNFEWTAQGA